MAETSFDVVIIGSGPGGYVCAIRAAQLGLKTAVIEKDSTFGGTCLNVGCIPSKALLQSSEYYAEARHGFSDHGIQLENLKIDVSAMQKRKEKIVSDLTGGIAFLFKKNKITSFNGIGSIKEAGKVQVQSADGQSQEIQAKHIVIATGSTPVELPFLKFDGEKIVNSTGALALTEVPKKLLVVGAGVIGLELGSVWMRLGAEVTAIEFADKICGAMDTKVSKQMERILSKQGMKFMLSTKVTGAEKTKEGVRLEYEDMKSGKTGTIDGDVVLVSTGRRPYTQGLGLENIGIEPDKFGRVDVNEHFQTKVPGVYAIGDVIRGPMLAHKAEEEGVALAEYLATGYGHVNYLTVPNVIYTWPEIASVGFTEDELKEKGIPYNEGKFPFTANGRAKALGSTEGSVRILAHKETDRILGCHIIGPQASDLIQEVVVAMEFHGSAEDLARSFHGHPTLSEVIREAALDVNKSARQM